jgi:hypothetical protein
MAISIGGKSRRRSYAGQICGLMEMEGEDKVTSGDRVRKKTP